MKDMKKQAKRSMLKKLKKEMQGSKPAATDKMTVKVAADAEAMPEALDMAQELLKAKSGMMDGGVKKPAKMAEGTNKEGGFDDLGSLMSGSDIVKEAMKARKKKKSL